MEQQTLVSLTVSQAGSSIGLLVSKKEFPELEKLRAEFEEDDLSADEDADAPLSTPERLCLRFVSSVMQGASRQSTVTAALTAFEDRFLKNNDIHTIAGQSPATTSEEKEFLKTYYSICDYCEKAPKPVQSALLTAAARDEASLFAAFGGQGAINPICLQELKELNRIYGPLLSDLIEEVSPLLEELSTAAEVADTFERKSIFISQWIEGTVIAPDTDDLATAPYSFPLIGLLGLCHYVVACKAAGLTPGQMRASLKGVTGHSQGIAVAAAVAVADTWDQFYAASKTIIEMLFWLGYYCQKESPKSPLPAKLITDSVDNGEGEPANLLSVRGMQRKQIDALVATVNKSLADDEKVYVALRNTSSNFVLAGPAHSLHGVNKQIRTIKASDGEVQSRIAFDKRKPIVYHSFLPVSAPFHTPYLKTAAEQTKKAMSATVIKPSALAIPLFETEKAIDLGQSSYENILHKLIDNICVEFADWPAVLKCNEATHIVSFDAGGIGNLVIQYKDGYGIRTIFGSDFGRSDDRAGRKSDLFSPSFASLSAQPQSWVERFAPRIEKAADGTEKVSTKLTRLLGLPHVTVAAMTPTTVPWDMCSAVMNAGYHIELAGGGYYNDANMTAAIKSLVGSIPVGRGITCNIIYSSPHSVQWQIPMFKRLVKEGVPIDGLSIGAGVPSPEVIEEYITTIGLRHITLKPGSHSAIRDTIAVAAAHPSFPVILQWTGGRGGGHHSYEDFHDPILDLYAEIRKYENLILVAGSGFGGAEDTYPYMTGQWSVDLYGRAPMPFDGILIGSRMMVAKEAHTSAQAKALICACPGTDANEWTDSYSKPVGGIITVKSEMGQPIHKVATRGVMLWAEMDKTFALPAEKRSKEIQSKKAYIIRRLNADFAKPYFGRNTAGQPVDVFEMTYAEVISRMIDLMYVRHQSRWVNKTYETFVCNMVKRTIERLGGSQKVTISSISDPLVFYKNLVDCIPAITSTIIDADDEAYFLSHCKKRGQKPINFVPIIDDGLETWMKKDSLWQSEDVEAVIDQDVQRVCILQGPVAARYCTKPDEPAKDILDNICSKHTEMMKADKKEVIQQATSDDSFGQTSPAIQALCSEEFVLRGSSRVENPLRRILGLTSASSHFVDDGQKLIISVATGIGREDNIVEVETTDGKNITVRLVFVKPGCTDGASLELGFLWHSERPFYQIEELTESRNSQIRDFYRKLWLTDRTQLNGDSNRFDSSDITLTATMADKINKAVKMADAAHLKSSMPTDFFPIDGLIMVSWNIAVKPLLIDTLDGDLLNLVHLSNKAEYLPGAQPFKIGDVISGHSQISSLSIIKPGKRLEVRAELCKDGKPVAVITSAFLFRGAYKDFHQTFKDIVEPEREMIIASKMDEAILKDRDWFKLNAAVSLVGKTVVFKLRTSCTWENADTFSNLCTKGEVFEKTVDEKLISVGEVLFEASQCHGNPVTDFLERKGRLCEKVIKLPQPGWDGDAFYEVQVPSTNEAYSMVSYDCNPIHTAPAFAAWANLPATITHGMYTSAIVRNMLESIIADGDRKRFRSFSSSFTGMVVPKDVLHVKLSHVAMQDGCKVFDIKVVKEEGGEQVLDGQAVVEEVPTTFIFTGQGSQSKGMGMDLYESSPVAKKLWDDTDKYLLNTYGWSILQVVRENPKSLTIYFGGKRGREIRKNYLALTIQTTRPDGTTVAEPILKSLTPTSMSYTFSEPRGLLFSTQFAQPAITLVSKAAFEDMRSKGLVPPGSTFAGHSLGEYGALSAFTEFIPFHTLMSVVFYRGLTMQVAMDRDEHGSTDFSMVAVNPGRVGKWFDEASLRRVLLSIATNTDGLMEIVNFNVKGEQYVAAGHLRNIVTLGGVMDHLFGNPEASKLVKDFCSASTDADRDATALGQVIAQEIAKGQALKKPFELKRCKATIPLQGIDVPFHSSYLRPSVPAYRHYLEQKLRVEDIVPERFLDKFIPNVMAKPFSLDSAYFAEAADLTGSDILRRVAETGIVAA